MKRNVLRKLRSNEGASLTFAILLFLVCAVIGTIVLTAGTIASGRLAEKAEMDQRYYNVTSVAEFLKDTLDGRPVIIVRENTTPTATVRVEGYDNPVSSEMDLDNYDFLTLKTLHLLKDLSWESEFYSEDVKTTNLSFQISGYGDSDGNIATIKATVKNGVMIIDISDNGYTVRMNFAPQISEVASRNDNGIEVKTATITWRVNNIEKVFG